MKLIMNKILFLAVLVYATYCCVYIYVYMRYPPFSSRNRASMFAAESASFSPATSIGRGNHKRTVQLHETVWGILTPSKFNGTWVCRCKLKAKIVQPKGIPIRWSNKSLNKGYPN